MNPAIMTMLAATLPTPIVTMLLLEDATKQPVPESSKAAEASLKAPVLLET